MLNYEAQLLAVLAATPAIAEKHSRVLVPAFFTVARQSHDDGVAIGRSNLSTRQRQQRTAGYLELLIKFVNPKAVFASHELHELFLSILSKGEPKLQSLALQCLMNYKSPKLLPYEERLKNLLDDAKFRDELAHLRLDVDTQVINPQHRDEVIPVTIRLLYGIISSRRGRSSTAQGSTARKQAVLTALSGCSSDELSILIDLMLEPLEPRDSDSISSSVDEGVHVAGRQQLGFLILLSDLLRFLGPQTVAYWPRLIGITINIVGDAQHRLDLQPGTTQTSEQEDIEIDAARIEQGKGALPLRHIRSLGIKRLVQFFRTTVPFDFTTFLPTIFKLIVSPRLDKLEIENTQAPSGTLDLLAAFAGSPETATALVVFDDRTLPKIFACMTAVKVKPGVVARVFDIIEALLDDGSPSICESVLLPHIHSLLETIIELVRHLKQSANTDIMTRLLSILSRLAAVITDGDQAQQLAGLLGPPLRQSSKQFSERDRVNVLKTLQRLYSISPDFRDSTSDFFVRNYELIANLFQTLFFPSSRRSLVAALESFAKSEPSLQTSFQLVSDINSYSSRRPEEPDFDRRLSAFALLNEQRVENLPATTREWLPLLRSGLFFIQEPEELSIRTNASSLIQRFVTLAGQAEDGPFVETVIHAVMPGLRRVLRSKNELVRNEALQVISHAVKTCSGLPFLEELRPLLADDEEANFFVNLAHIQVHRRARALRRLRLACAEGEIRETSLSNIFLPLLDHIIAGTTDVTDHHLINEAISTIGALAGRLRWSRYNALFIRYLRLAKQNTTHQKSYVRAVSSIIDGFHFDLLPAATTTVSHDVDVAQHEDQTDDVSEDQEPSATPAAIDIEPNERIPEIILSHLLPALSDFVSQKDGTDDTIRIPLALPIVKLASALPGESSSIEILRTITTVSQILRSKDQDTRDIARDTISKITVFLGPDWLVRVLNELRSALQRGPQKHVAAVVTHAILVLATGGPGDRFGNLDEAVEDIVHISAEVLWGESGRDVEVEGFRTKMREVRGAASRGFDALQLVSRLVSPAKIGAVLAPLRDVMAASQAVKMMQHVDEALRRITIGLNANPQLCPENLLSLCYSLVSGNSNYLKTTRKASRDLKASDTHRVQMKRDAKEDTDFFPLNAHKLVAFGLDMFVTAFRRGNFDFDDVSILARLGPFVNAIGDTLYSPTSSILVLGLKATAAIARCPLPQLEPALPVFVKNILRVLKQAGGNAESEVAQTAIKTLAVIIRDCKASEVSETQLSYLLDVISPDLEDPGRQSTIFAILRAIITRRFVSPEIYDLMDRVSSIMVTSQSIHAQEVCRGVLIQFLLDYPQGQGRLKAQMTFLARNLDYVFTSGRMSVMELLAAVFTKFSDELIEEYADLYFVALVAVVANDDAEKCRLMAGALIKQLFTRMGRRQQSGMLRVLRSWVDQGDDQGSLASASLAVYALLSEASDIDNGLSMEIVRVVGPIIEKSAAKLAEAEDSSSDVIFEVDHNASLHALSAALNLTQVNTEISSELPWSAISAHMLFPQDSVRFSAARAVAALLSTGPERKSVLDEDALLDIAKKSCLLLQGSRTTDGEMIVVEANIADVLVKLLWNISKHWMVTLRIFGQLTDQLTSFQISEPDTISKETDNDVDDVDGNAPDKGQPLPWLMSRISFIARHLIIHRPTPHQETTSLVRGSFDPECY